MAGQAQGLGLPELSIGGKLSVPLLHSFVLKCDGGWRERYSQCVAASPQECISVGLLGWAAGVKSDSRHRFTVFSFLRS